LQKWPSPRAMASIRAKVKERTRRRSGELAAGRRCRRPQPGAAGLGELLPLWQLVAKFNAVDSYVHERMAMLASTKYGLHGRNWATRFTYGWMTDLGIYRLTGTVRYWAASSLTVNDVGEPDEWRTSCPESIGGGWRSQHLWRGRTCTFGKPEGLSLHDLKMMAEPAAYLTDPKIGEKS
jgi:hypothetical protein